MALEHFTQVMDARVSRGGLKSIAHANDIVRDLLSNGAVERYVLERLRTVAVHADFEDLGWSRRGLQLARGSGWALHLSAFDGNSGGIYTHAQFGCMGLARGRFHLTSYALPATFRHDEFDKNLHLANGECTTMERGDVFALDAERHAYQFSAEKVVCILLLSSPTAELRQRFDPITKCADMSSAARSQDTELISMAKTLGRLKGSSASETLHLLTSHPRHFVRWAAVQNLARVDAQAARERVREMLDDPSAPIRAAARKTLAGM